MSSIYYCYKLETSRSRSGWWFSGKLTHRRMHNPPNNCQFHSTATLGDREIEWRKDSFPSLFVDLDNNATLDYDKLCMKMPIYSEYMWQAIKASEHYKCDVETCN
ncbi:unnamed protein product, partial [Mesorhabditis spiculigera]